MENNALAAAARRGDREALAQLILARQQEYYRLAYAFLSNREDTLDAIEDMLEIICRQIGRLRQPELFPAWSKTILVNCCRRRLQERRREFPLTAVPAGEASGLPDKDEQLWLEQHLSRLDHRHQEVIRLRYFLDLDYQTIAAVLRLPLGTVKSRLSLGLKKLRQSIGGEANG